MQEFVGRQEKREWTVTKEMLAVQMGSGMVPVLATPALIACMENACMRLVQPAFGEGITTVGTRVEVAHLAPTPEGARIQVTATLLATDGGALPTGWRPATKAAKSERGRWNGRVCGCPPSGKRRRHGSGPDAGKISAQTR